MVAEIMTAAVIGGMTYDLVKGGLKVTAALIKAQAKDMAIKWLLDDEATEEVVARVNQLGYEKDESQEQFQQRLDRDELLVSLINQRPAYQQNVTISGGEARFAGRDYYESPKAPPPKKS